jgi:hypothetical protein
MSTPSLLAFLTKLDREFTENTPEAKRLEYNLNTHTFTYDENTFVGEMLGELKKKSIRLTKKRETEVRRLAGFFSKDLYTSLAKINEVAKAKKGVTRLKGSETSFSFVFTTDIRTGKTPNNWAQGQADVFDKIKVSYSDAYRKFFFGIKASFAKGSKALQKFNKNYNLREEQDIQSKGKMGHSGHAEGEGVIETMTREFFDKHANTVYSKGVNSRPLTEVQLLSDLNKMGVDITFMRSTSDMTQNISLIGAGGNIIAGAEMKKLLNDAKKRIRDILDNPAMLNKMMDLEGSDSFRTIKKKQTRKKATEPFKKLKNPDIVVDAKNLTVKHSKKTVKTEKNSKGRKGAKPKGSVSVKGLAALASAKKTKRRPTQKSPLQDMLKLAVQINSQLPQTVRKNMGTPALNNVTGRFANSTQVTDVQITPQGFPSVGYTYQKGPYQVFEEGLGSPPWANGYRDPRELIDKSIREIASQMALGRIYTRRV